MKWSMKIPARFGVRSGPLVLLLVTSCNTANEHARQCETELGPIPSFQCTDGAVVPILVDGIQVDQHQSGTQCDQPAIADANCRVGTRVGRIETQDAVWTFLCRNGDDMVQLIGHNPETGATCFFETVFEVSQQSDALTVETGTVQGLIPAPGDSDYATVWKAPARVALQRCWSCHGADAFVHSPYIDGAMTDDGERVVPNVSGPDSAYYLVGDAFERRTRGNERLRSIHIEGNGCLECHRYVDVRQFGEDFAEPWDINARMPPDDPGSMESDYQALWECAQDGPENTQGCSWRDVPGE